ncbi:hypothetical protein [Paraburkholderia sp.]|jgi:hypothetical protein|uniref:hypothetical protein n=1 Tax=Paraburkholderia sp. TaxID=1926495 RepID=UPI002F3FBEC6
MDQEQNKKKPTSYKNQNKPAVSQTKNQKQKQKKKRIDQKTDALSAENKCNRTQIGPRSKKLNAP